MSQKTSRAEKAYRLMEQAYGEKDDRAPHPLEVKHIILKMRKLWEQERDDEAKESISECIQSAEFLLAQMR